MSFVIMFISRKLNWILLMPGDVWGYICRHHTVSKKKKIEKKRRRRQRRHRDMEDEVDKTHIPFVCDIRKQEKKSWYIFDDETFLWLKYFSNFSNKINTNFSFSNRNLQAREKKKLVTTFQRTTTTTPAILSSPILTR